MNIGTALNKKYIPYTVVMLSSLCINNKEHIDTYLFHSELTQSDIELMTSSLETYDITLIPIKIDVCNFNERMPRNEQWTLEAYYRLLMFDVLPDTVNRLLYLDGDVIVNNPVSDLYYKDFCGNDLLVCDDKGGLNTPDKYGNKHREMFVDAYKHGFRYFNSGVLLINVSKLRSHCNFNSYLTAMEEWNYEMEAPDQDILNWVHWKNVGYIDHKKYDLFARVAHNQKITYSDAKNKASIIHYPGYKPWEAGSFHYDIEKIWWEYAKKTCFYDNLLVSFVSESLSNTNVSNYIASLEDTYQSKRELLSKTLLMLNKLIDTSKLHNLSDTNNDKPVPGCGYYSYEEQKQWKNKLFPNPQINQLEQYLDLLLSDTSDETYAIELNDSIQQIDQMLFVAKELIGGVL